ncbi:MAG TPA: ABC transporter ATP-binding protein [Syntrophomonas sp.]|nr:ABC transporter ATP-binding protein [Syntrophomonas sp.]
MKLQLKNISVTLQNKLILDSLHLEVGEGELISLLGPSGCGKSTLLKTIAGLISPRDGEIVMDDTIANHRPAGERGAVIVFQDLRLFPNMSVLDNVAFPFKIRGISKENRRLQARKLLKSVQLEGLENRKIHAISGGQQQRVALARALAAGPKLLLLDEPFASLDDNLRQDMRRLVLDLHRKHGITTILVTHDQQEALMMSNRIALMMEGRIIQFDTPQNIYNAPANKTVADYFGGGSYINGEVKSNRFNSDIVDFSVEAPDGKYLALFRPPALRLAQGNDSYQVVDMKYLGEKWEIQVEGKNCLFLLAAPNGHGLEIGARAGLDFDCQQAVMIPQ